MSKRNEFLTSSKRKNSESIMTLLTPAVHDCHGGFHNSPSSISHPLALFHNSGGTYEYEEAVSEGSNIKQAKKKTRLTNHQVKYLERSFEVDTKLDLERKNQLAQDLGLQSRQVAIWFQNRRARSKSKQLERDYNNLKVLYDAAFSEKQKLEAQVLKLKEMLKMRGEESRKEDNEPSQVTSVDRVQVDINVNASTVISKTAVNPIESCMQEKIVQEAEFSCRTEQSELVNADSSNEEDEDIAHVLVKDTRNENMELIIRNAYPQGHISLHLETAPFINGFPPEYEEQALAMANFEWSYGLWQYDPSSLFV